MTKHRAHIERTSKRRGSAYLLVLGASLLLVTAGMGAIYASGVRRAGGELQIDAWKSRLAAEAGIECAMDVINTNASWRTSHTSGNWYTNRPTGDGSFTVDVTDTIDGNLGNNPGDPVEIVAVGSSGRGRAKMKVSLNPQAAPLSCLGAVLCSGGAQTITTTTVNNDQIIHSNTAITAVFSTVSGTASSALTTLGLTFTGSALSLQQARTLPAAGDLTYYATNATPIPRASLNRIGQNWLLEDAVLSPASNPYGSTNAAGLYVIDMSNDDLIVRNCRIVGTLVVVNAGAGSQVRASVNWSPATPNYPILLLQGNVELRFDSTTALSESGLNVNFNPIGTPYGGVSDADRLDSYPSEMRGLIYITGNLTTAISPKIVGNIVVRGTVTTAGTLTLNYTPTCFTAPPPGFVTTPVPIKAIPGTWQQLVD